MIRALGVLTAGLLAFTLAGCANDAGPEASTRTSSGTEPTARRAAEPAKPMGPAPVKAAPMAATPVAAIPGGSGSGAAGPGAPAKGDPDRLRNLDGAAVSRLIGLPHYIRRDGSAVVWQYRSTACVMDLFWYPAADRALRVLHYEVRSVRLADVAERRSCFDALLMRHSVAVAS